MSKRSLKKQLAIKQGPSVEQRLFEAYKACEGIELSPLEVISLVRDDAVGTRITEFALNETGMQGAEGSSIGSHRIPETWEQFKLRLRQ